MTVSRTSVVLVAACCLALGSTTGAVAGAMITGKDVKNGSLTGKDVRDGSLTARDLGAGTITPTGPGAPGPAGPAGAPGAPGASGVSGYRLVEVRRASVPAGTTGEIVSVDCPAGTKVLSGAAYWGTVDEALQVTYDISAQENSVSAYSDGISTIDDATVQAICAVVTTATP